MQHRALIPGVLWSILIVAACNIGEPNMRDANTGKESLASLSAELKLQFPPSARLVGVHRSPGGMDDAVRVKLDVTANELPSLLSQTQIDAESFEAGTGGLMGPDDGFWDPHEAPALRTGQAKRPSGRVLNIGIDESRPNLAIVYIVEHGT